MPKAENKYSKINCYARIEEYIKSNKGMAALCREMYRQYFKDKKTEFGITDEQKFVNEASAYLNTALKGGKGLSVHYVLALEKVLGASFHDIVYSDDPNIKEIFDPISIRHAVFTNDYEECKRLSELVYERKISRRYDEFDNTVFYYLIKRKAEGKPVDQILRFLLDNEELIFNRSSLAAHSREEGEVIYEMIIKLDDYEKFSAFAPRGCKFFNEYEDLEAICFDGILSTKNIYKGIITHRETDIYGVKIPSLDPNFEALLSYCAKKNLRDKYEEMITAYEEYIDRIIDDERAKRSDSVMQYFAYNYGNNGRMTLVRECDEKHTPICELLEFDRMGAIADEALTERLKALALSEIIKRINYKSLEELDDGDYYIDYEKGKIYYKMAAPTADISLFLEMTKRGYTCIPQCEKVGEDLYMCEWQPEKDSVKGKSILSKYGFVFKALGEIHKVLLDMRSDGRVYSFRLFSMFDRKPRSFSDPLCWKPYLNLNFVYGAYLTSPTDSLIDMIIRFFYSEENVGNFIEKYDRYSYMASCIKESLRAYALPEVLEGIGDKMLSKTEEELEQLARSKDDFDFVRYNDLTHLRSVLLLIKDELNALASNGEAK